MTLPERTEALYFFLDRLDVWTLPAERLRDGLIDVAGIMSPAIEIVISNHLSNAGPIIIEGDGIHPDLLSREELRPGVASGRLRAVFVDEPDEESLCANYLARKRGIDIKSESYLRNEARAKAMFSHWIAGRAAHHGLPLVPSRPFETLSERILAAAELPYPG